MGRSGKGVRIAPGIHQYGERFRVRVKVGVAEHEKWFPASDDRDADLVTMERWQLHNRADLLGEQPVRASRDTLTADVPRFLATFPADSPARRDYEKLLATWTNTPLALRPRSDIRRRDVLAQLSAWETDGYAPVTLNHRLRALRKLYDVLDSEDDEAINPCAKIKKRPEGEPEERGTTHDIIEGILACIPDIGYAAERKQSRPTMNKSKARLRVMAWTGLPPALIRRIKPEHIHWQDKALDVTPRRKGKGVKARRLPLLDEAVEALRAFDAAGAYGSYSNAAPWTAWQRAKRRYLDQVRESAAPKAVVDELARVLGPLRPYDLRHSFAAMVYEHSDGNQHAVKDLLMHGSLTTSDRYIKRAVEAVSRTALAAVTAARAVPAGARRPDPKVAEVGRKRAVLPRLVHSPKTAKPRHFLKKTRS